METLGQRLRRLRQEAGLSQTDLSSAAVSASYISLIESGKRAPGPEVVQYLATRLSCSSEYLLIGSEAPSTASARMDLAFATLALSEGHPAAAVQRLEAMDLTGLPTDLAEQVQRGLAKALLGVGSLERAIELLEPVLMKARREHRTLDQLVVATTLVATYLQAGDLTRAVELAEETLQYGRNARLDESTEYVRLLVTLTWALYERGDVHYARQRLREVLPAVEATGDPRARGSVYWNAALFAKEVGHDSEAIELTRRAMGLISEHSDQVDLARLRLHLGWLLLRGAEADPGAALDELRSAQPAVQQYASTIDMAGCFVEQARALLALGRIDEALDHAQRAINLLRTSGRDGEVGEAPRYQSVEALLVLAEIQDTMGETEAATVNYRKAADTVGMMTTNRKSAEIWGSLAERLRVRGDVEGAMRAYQHAMRAAGIRAAVSAQQTV